MEQINSLISAMEDDDALANEIQRLAQAGNISKLVETAAQKGFIITEADWNESMDAGSAENGEMSEDQLENVTGGSHGTGNLSDPLLSPECWYWSPYGSDKCKRETCVKYTNGKHGWLWYKCRCHGTSRCKNNFHTGNRQCSGN